MHVSYLNNYSYKIRLTVMYTFKCYGNIKFNYAKKNKNKKHKTRMIYH